MVRRLIVNTAVVMLAAILLSGPMATSEPARAQVYDRGTRSGPFSFVERDCGFPVRVEGRSREKFVSYTVPGSSGQAFLEHRRYSFRKAITNPATGKSVVITGWGTYRETEATHVEGDVWEVIARERGKPFVVRDARGRVVLADGGTLTTRSILDTFGDGRPSGEELEREVVSTVGRFPSLTDDFDYCALVSRLTR
jgi:hypothetical protein